MLPGALDTRQKATLSPSFAQRQMGIRARDYSPRSRHADRTRWVAPEELHHFDARRRRRQRRFLGAA